MTRSTGKRKFHFKNVRPKDPAVKAYGDWLPANRGFYEAFRHWLRDGGYGDSAVHIYSVATRLALGWLDQPYWMIDLVADLDRVRDYVASHYESPSTRAMYFRGLAKLEEYLRFRRQKPTPEKRINWEHYVGSLPDWLRSDVRAYVAHRRRSWLPECRYKASQDLVSHLTLFLRWAAEHATLADARDLTPDLWFDYVDQRLTTGIKPRTVNAQLIYLHRLLQFLVDQGRPVCQRTLRIEPLERGPRLPRDVPLDHVRRLWDQIEVDAASTRADRRRMGLMDRAWWLLMLHSGLRVGEVRRLRFSELDLENRKLRVEQSKGLKDRVVYLSVTTVEALQAYFEMRGPAATDHVFLFRHKPLGPTYCNRRLATYGRRCGVKVTCHQLRHSFATLILNAGAPVLAVQTILGHEYVDTTLTYTRLYDRTVAADYYRAMRQVEARTSSNEEADDSPPHGGYLLALVDTLGNGTLNEEQRETVQALREGILALVTATDAHCRG